jgi:rSAM/selenodomain-associated transferase 1
MNNTASLKATDIAIYTTPDIQHPYIKNLSQQYSTTLHCQQGKDLGERMHHALAESLQHYKKSILIGSDCPEMDIKYIEKAFKALSQHDKVTDIVLGPAEDGGYVLIGASRIHAELFNNINWGTESVLQQTLKKIDSMGYRYQLLNTLRDIDTPEDYIHYQSQTNPNKKNQQETQ